MVLFLKFCCVFFFVSVVFFSVEHFYMFVLKCFTCCFWHSGFTLFFAIILFLQDIGLGS